MNERDLPLGLLEETGRILASHIGLERAIKRSTLLEILSRKSPRYCNLSDRKVRDAIALLRDQEWLICSLGSDSDGYYLAASKEEYQEFRPVYFAHMHTMIDRLKKMDQAAERKWGAGVLQDRLL